MERASSSPGTRAATARSPASPSFATAGAGPASSARYGDPLGALVLRRLQRLVQLRVPADRRRPEVALQRRERGIEEPVAVEPALGGQLSSAPAQRLPDRSRLGSARGRQLDRVDLEDLPDLVLQQPGIAARLSYVGSAELCAAGLPRLPIIAVVCCRQGPVDQPVADRGSHEPPEIPRQRAQGDAGERLAKAARARRGCRSRGRAERRA